MLFKSSPYSQKKILALESHLKKVAGLILEHKCFLRKPFLIEHLCWLLLLLYKRGKKVKDLDPRYVIKNLRSRNIMTEDAKTANKMYLKISIAIKMASVSENLVSFYISNMFQRHINHNRSKSLGRSLIVFHLLCKTL